MASCSEPDDIIRVTISVMVKRLIAGGKSKLKFISNYQKLTIAIAISLPTVQKSKTRNAYAIVLP